MAATQMNIRIDSELKREGDAVLGSLGLAPSQAVRGFWRFVVSHGDDPDAIKKVVGEATADDEIVRRLDALAEGRRICVGLGPLAREVADRPYEDLRDEAYARRFKESG